MTTQQTALRSPVRYIGRCNGCKRGVRLTFVATFTEYRGHSSYTKLVTEDGRAFTRRDNGPRYWIAVPCDCGKIGQHGNAPVAVCVQMTGRVAPQKRCDARCEGATGHNCECSCGGENHGAAHAA